MAFCWLENDDEEEEKKMRNMFSPELIDQMIHYAMQMIWIRIPKEKRNIDQFERLFRRIVDRALANLRDDFDEFGRGGESSGNGR